jgi:2-oxopent-4-enoate/cis-2-oxohex-4-enoate hydratase
MLADYDAHRPNEIFAERGTEWLTLEDAYMLQRAVAQLRLARGERCVGYKIGCLSSSVQEQLGLRQPVCGYLWHTEAISSGSRLIYQPPGSSQECRFVNLAIEGEIALRLGQDVPAETTIDQSIDDCVECWFPVIELHNAVFRGLRPTSQELVAGNAMHAGFVAPSFPGVSGLSALDRAEIRIEIDGELIETKGVADLPGGPLGSVRRLASLLRPIKETLKAGDIVLTGSPGRLIPIGGSCTIAVGCQGQRVELFVESAPVRN